MKTHIFVAALLAVVLSATFASALTGEYKTVDDNKPWWQRSGNVAAPKEGGAAGKAFNYTKNWTVKTTDVECIQKAVVTRENAMISAHQNFSASMTKALETRRDALKAGWAESKERGHRKTVIAKVWMDFKASQFAAHKTFKNARNAAWKQWENDMKSCKMSKTEDPMTEPIDRLTEAVLEE